MGEHKFVRFAIAVSSSFASVALFFLSILGCSQGKEDEGSISINESTQAYPFNFSFAAFGPQENSVTSFSTQQNLLAAGALPTGCQFNLPQYLETAPAPVCFGPVTYFANHPDIPSWVVNKDTNYWISAGYPDDGVFGQGELGIGADNENGQACVIAQARYQALTQLYRLRMAQTIGSAAHCVIKTSGRGLPTAGQTLDLKALMASTIAHDPRLSFEQADFSRESANGASGNPIYRYDLKLKYYSTTFTVKWRHTSTGDQSKYSGEIEFQSASPVTSVSRAISSKWVYEKDGTIQRSSAADSLSEPHDGFKIRTEIDSATGASSVRATVTPKVDPLSSTPEYVRVWNLNIKPDGSGCGFHGYADIDSNSISKYKCNGGKADFLPRIDADLAQKQCFNTAGLTTISKIAYAPTSGCTKSVNQLGTIQFHDYFRYSTTLPSTETINGWEIATNWTVNETHATTHDLINVTNDPDFATIRVTPEPNSGL